MTQAFCQKTYYHYIRCVHGSANLQRVLIPNLVTSNAPDRCLTKQNNRSDVFTMFFESVSTLGIKLSTPECDLIAI